MNAFRYTVAVAGALAAGVVLAQSGADVVKSKGCLNCHAVDQKKVGPSFKDIAAKKLDSNALVTQLKEGKGHPKIAASEAEIKAAVDYVQSQK
jgi:cytochrome c551/c552